MPIVYVMTPDVPSLLYKGTKTIKDRSKKGDEDYIS